MTEGELIGGAGEGNIPESFVRRSWSRGNSPSAPPTSPAPPADMFSSYRDSSRWRRRAKRGKKMPELFSIDDSDSAAENDAAGRIRRPAVIEIVRKRKSSSMIANVNRDDDSDNSEIEELLPASKKQRVTVGAVRRLLAVFTLSDTNTTTSTITTTSPSKNNNNLEQCMNKNTDLNINTHEDEAKKVQETNQVKEEVNKKRQATDDVNNSDSDDNSSQQQRKIKKTRRLRRGLRLCSNITCYIEQIIYS